MSDSFPLKSYSCLILHSPLCLYRIASGPDRRKGDDDLALAVVPLSTREESSFLHARFSWSSIERRLGSEISPFVLGGCLEWRLDKAQSRWTCSTGLG